MWNNLKDKTIVFPNSSTIILLTDIDENEHSSFKYTIMPVIKVLEICDKPYCRWTHWMEIPSTKTIDEKELNLLADNYVVNLDEGGGAGCYDDITIQEAFKAGYRKAKEE